MTPEQIRDTAHAIRRDITNGNHTDARERMAALAPLDAAAVGAWMTEDADDTAERLARWSQL